MASKLPKLNKSGWTSYVGPTVKGERAVVKGIKSDAAQFGVRSPGKSAKSSNGYKVRRTNSSNSGSFKK